jgi:hypothetical protein
LMAGAAIPALDAVIRAKQIVDAKCVTRLRDMKNLPIPQAAFHH